MPDVTGSDLAQWLQEAARRRTVRPAPGSESGAEPVAEAEAPAPRHHLRTLLLAALAAVAFLPYLFADVQLTIYKLHSLIVFVFPD